MIRSRSRSSAVLLVLVACACSAATPKVGEAKWQGVRLNYELRLGYRPDGLVNPSQGRVGVRKIELRRIRSVIISSMFACL